MNKFTRGISTDGSASFALLGAQFTKAENHVKGSLPLFILYIMVQYSQTLLKEMNPDDAII